MIYLLLIFAQYVEKYYNIILFINSYLIAIMDKSNIYIIIHIFKNLHKIIIHSF